MHTVIRPRTLLPLPALGAALALALLLVAARGAAAAQTATTVNVDLAEWTVTPDVSGIPAGDVTFVVSNSSAEPHELVIIATDLAADALPLAADGQRVDEAQVTAIGEVEEFAPGGTESATFALSPGRYLLICNLPDHYAFGMVVEFLVTGPDALPATGSGGLARTDGGASGIPSAPVLASLGVVVAGLALPIAAAARRARREGRRRG